MQEIVEIGRATQDELRDDLRELFQGAIRLTLEMVLEEELKARRPAKLTQVLAALVIVRETINQRHEVDISSHGSSVA